MTTAHHRLVQLLDYVVEQSRTLDPKTFNLTRSPGLVYAGDVLTGLPGVDLNLQVQGEPVWLRVHRLAKTSAPLNDPHRLLTGGEDPRGTPPTVEGDRWTAYAAEAFAEAASETLPAHETEDARAWRDAWLAEQVETWHAWAEEERPRRLTIQFYQKLFEVKQALEHDDAGKPQELVVGMGVAAQRLKVAGTAPDSAPVDAKTSDVEGTAGPESAPVAKGRFGRPGAPSGYLDLQYPLITQVVQVTMNPVNGALDVRPRLLPARLEMEAFALANVPGVALVEAKAGDDLAGLGETVSPFDAPTLAPLLRNVAESLDAAGRYAQGKLAWPVATEHLVVSDAWVLMVRPRSTNYLHEDVARLQDSLRKDLTLPPGAGALVTPPDDTLVEFKPMLFRGRSGMSGDAHRSGTPHELYFPLPYNREQVSIVERLEQADGMTVQGPPGTGKTHTIANIVCHYLATGRKVLVTSKGEKALAVLQEKIPTAVRPLTVALLADDKVGARQFQASIDTIMLQVSQMNPTLMQEEIRALERQIDQAHAHLAQVDRRLTSIAHEQRSSTLVDGEPCSAKTMAELVVNSQGHHDWFDDTLTLDPMHEPPFPDSDAAALRQARRQLGQDLLTLNDRPPASASLPSATTVQGWHEALCEAWQMTTDEQVGDLWPVRQASENRDRAINDLIALLDRSVQSWVTLQAAIDAGEAWIPSLRARCRDASYTSELQALEALFKNVDKLVAQRASFLKVPVVVPEAALDSDAFAEVVARARQTGKPFTFFSRGDASTRSWVDAVKVAGTAPSTADAWQHVQDYLALHTTLRSFVVRWNHLVEDLGIPVLGTGLKALRRVETLVRLVRDTHRLAVGIDLPAQALAEQVFLTPDLSVLTGDVAGIKALHDQLVRRRREPVHRTAAQDVASLRLDLAVAHGDLEQGLHAWAQNVLGNVQLDCLEVVRTYGDWTERVRRWESLKEPRATVVRLTEAVEQAGAGRWAHRLRTVVVPEAGDDPAFPNDWQTAWKLARFRTHLERIEARHEMTTLAARRGQLEQDLATLYENLVAKTAWLSTKMNATPKVLSALETYQTAVRHIGKGTGVNAPRHRRDAQKAMREAQGAIPCWIMSHAKVSESLPAEMGHFDLVIVDEASQSDLGSLPSVLRGKKILVVGDDKQVSPTATAVAAEHVQSLRERFLADQPYAAMLTPEKSLYEITKAVFAGHSVMLREHFRCVPAIVEYSNKTFYDGGIQPLRIPTTNERLDPPLIDWYVEHGVRTKDRNVGEAECIAAEIEAILNSPDKRFKGKTIGVVSMQGMEQAKLIDTLVRERCDGAELEARHFDCGTARLFQGGERDIMFLSMVVSENQVQAATKKLDEQVFNVAATRARDRMYLVRSVNMEHLSATAEDLRKGLLQHFQQPLHGSYQATDESLEKRCESEFERQVYTELVQRGYRVIPQVPAGGFRLDMVVEGDRDARLAIECDGDAYHGPDQWEHDMARQRVLERAGWTFWRCFASTWTLHRQAVVQELLEKLASMNIEPLGALESIPSLTEHRVWTHLPHEAPKVVPSVAQEIPSSPSRATSGSKAEAVQTGAPTGAVDPQRSSRADAEEAQNHGPDQGRPESPPSYPTTLPSVAGELMEPGRPLFG